MRKLTVAALLLGQLAVAPAWGLDTFTVRKIQVQGAQKISKDAVLQELPIQVGEKITASDTPRIIRKLFKTGFFKKIDLLKDGNTLIVQVEERPSISRFELKGVRSKDDIKKILKDHDIADGRIYDPAKLGAAEQELERYYLSKGRYGVKIDSKVTEIERNRVELVLHIYEGDEARIKQVRIIGNQVFPEKTLKKVLNHSPTNWLTWYNKKDRYAKEKLEADLELLRSYYMDRGYLNFQIESTQVSLSPDKKDLYLTINVSEGELYYFGTVTIAGDTIVKPVEIQELVHFHIQPDAVFSRKELWDAKKDIEDRLGQEGYSKADIRINFVEDEENKRINVEFYIEPSNRVMVRWIDFEGNSLTQDQVLRRGNRQFESTWISTKDVQEGKDYILRNGFARKVDVDTKEVPGRDDQVDVKYSIEESRTASVSAGIAYSAADRLMFNLGADLKNFVGTGKDVNFAFNNSSTFTTYSVGYFNPYFTKDGIGFGYNIYYHKNNLSQTSDIFDYRQNSKGADISWSLPLTQYDSISFTAGYDDSRLKFAWDDEGDAALRQAQINLAPTEVINFINREGRKFQEYTLSIGWVHNSLDRFLFPTQGWRQKIAGKLAVPGSTLKYYRLVYEYSWFKPLPREGHIFNFNTNLGFGHTYGETQRYPFFKHFFAGGPDSIRGFDARSLGPRDSRDNVFGGNVLLYGNLTYVFPTPFAKNVETVRTALFLDAGQVYDTQISNANPKGLRYSVGTSLTWNTPLGVPLVFSLTKALNKGDKDKTKAFDFTFGTQFM